MTTQPQPPSFSHAANPAPVPQGGRVAPGAPAAPAPAAAPMHVVEARGLTKVYGEGEARVVALDSASLVVGRGEFVAIMGPSGSGKSTLLHCLAGLDTPTSGSVLIAGQDLSGMKDKQLTAVRRDRLGFIFQSFNLVPTLTAAENITLPLDIARKKVNPQRFDQVIDAVGLRERLSHRPAELSGGQVQRVACARALVGEPAVVFADEPTGNLDSVSTDQVLEILRRSVDDLGQSVVMVTHEPEAAAWADTVIFLRDGHVVAQLDEPDRDRVLDALRELSETEPAPAAAAPFTGSAVEGA